MGGPKVNDVTPQEARDRREPGATLLDVREDDEWSVGHAPDAVHVPLAGAGDAAARFTGQEVLTVCRSGTRSAKAAETLAQSGVEVRNVAGGMTAWAAAGLPMVRDDGEPGAVA